MCVVMQSNEASNCSVAATESHHRRFAKPQWEWQRQVACSYSLNVPARNTECQMWCSQRCCLLRIHVSWDVTSFLLMGGYRRSQFRITFIFLGLRDHRRWRHSVWNHTASHPTRTVIIKCSTCNCKCTPVQYSGCHNQTSGQKGRKPNLNMWNFCPTYEKLDFASDFHFQEVPFSCPAVTVCGRRSARSRWCNLPLWACQRLNNRNILGSSCVREILRRDNNREQSVLKFL